MCHGVYVVVRVDQCYPRTWFRDYNEFNQACTTTQFEQAARMGYDEAKQAIYCLQIDHGGVWGLRKAEDGNPGGDVT